MFTLIALDSFCFDLRFDNRSHSNLFASSSEVAYLNHHWTLHGALRPSKCLHVFNYVYLDCYVILSAKNNHEFNNIKMIAFVEFAF